MVTMGFSIVTNQQINDFYNKYRENEILFTKDITRSLRMDPRQVYVKCAGSQWPCIVNSISFQQAKIIIGTNGGAFHQITKEDAPPTNLRLCFIEPDNQPLFLYVTCRVTDVTPYMNSQELAIITLSYTQRPSDDFIYKLGSLIDAKEGFVYRKEERIILNEETKRILGINKKETIVCIQNVPRRCILYNVSFTGAKVVVLGLAKFLLEKNCVIRLLFDDPSELIDVKGVIVSANQVPGRAELVEAGIKFDENQVPIAYKMRINDYLSNKRKKFLDYASHSEVAKTVATVKKVITEKVKEAKESKAEAKSEAKAETKADATKENPQKSEVKDSAQSAQKTEKTETSLENKTGNTNE